jgi:hypothetical protein
VAFSVFCLVLALMLPEFGVTYSFLVSLACATLVHAISRAFLERTQQGVPEDAFKATRL